MSFFSDAEKIDKLGEIWDNGFTPGRFGFVPGVKRKYSLDFRGCIRMEMICIFCIAVCREDF